MSLGAYWVVSCFKGFFQPVIPPLLAPMQSRIGLFRVKKASMGHVTGPTWQGLLVTLLNLKCAGFVSRRVHHASPELLKEIVPFMY